MCFKVKNTILQIAVIISALIPFAIGIYSVNTINEIVKVSDENEYDLSTKLSLIDRVISKVKKTKLVMNKSLQYLSYKNLIILPERG